MYYHQTFVWTGLVGAGVTIVTYLIPPESLPQVVREIGFWIGVFILVIGVLGLVFNYFDPPAEVPLVARSSDQARASLIKQERLALKEQRNKKSTEVESHLVRAKLQIAEQLSHMKSLATERGAWGKPHFERGESFMTARSLANSRIEEISYETQLRIDCIDFIHLCEVIIATDRDHELNEDERNQLHALSVSLMQKLHGKG